MMFQPVLAAVANCEGLDENYALFTSPDRTLFTVTGKTVMDF
jgi:hypothetical protein